EAVEQLLGGDDVALERGSGIAPRGVDSSHAGEVVHGARLQRADARSHGVSIEQVDFLPAREWGQSRWRVAARPSDDVVSLGQALQKVAASEPGRAGDENAAHLPPKAPTKF